MTNKLRAELHRDNQIARIARRQHGLITSRQFEALGLSRQAISDRCAFGRLHRVHRGVYAVGHAAISPAARRLAAVLTYGDEAVASHVGAAVTWELRKSSSRLQHVTVPGHARSRPGIRVHLRTLVAADRGRRDGIPVTSLARTLVDLGDVVPSAHVRSALVRAEQLRIVDMTAIDAALARAGRTRGAAVLRGVLRIYDPRWEQTRSELELALLDLVTTQGLPLPEINAWIESRFLVDALWRRQRFVVEVDGAAFHDTPSARRDDARRDRMLRVLGYDVRRFSYAEMTASPDHVARTLRTALGAT